jgi:hypothetical protein
MEKLNILSNGDIYQLDYDDIKRIFKNHSRSSRNKGIISRGLVSQCSNPITHINNELGGLIENMKIDILHSLSMQIYALQIKKKQEEEEKALVVYCPKCTKNPPRNECHLDLIYVCGICEENHPTNKCSYFLGLKSKFQGPGENVESLYFINQRRHGAPRPFQTGLNFNHAQNFNEYNSQMYPQPWYNPSPRKIQIIGTTKDLQFFLHTNLFLECHKISGVNHHKDGCNKIFNLHYCILLLKIKTLLKIMLLLNNLNYPLNLLQIRKKNKFNLCTTTIQLIKIIHWNYKR